MKKKKFTMKETLETSTEIPEDFELNNEFKKKFSR